MQHPMPLVASKPQAVSFASFTNSTSWSGDSAAVIAKVPVGSVRVAVVPVLAADLKRNGARLSWIKTTLNLSTKLFGFLEASSCPSEVLKQRTATHCRTTMKDDGVLVFGCTEDYAHSQVK
jgi:hypothetical protein